MKTRYFLCILPLLAVVACNKTAAPEVVSAPASFKIVVDDTKTAIDDQHHWTWEGTETVKVAEVLTQEQTTNHIYNFTCTEVTDGVATFTCATFDGDFATKKYAVLYNNTRTGNFNRNQFKSQGGAYSTSVLVPMTQTYTPGNYLGIANGIIPMYGLINENGGYMASAVEMSTNTAIVALNLTSNAAATVGKITLETSVPHTNGSGGVTRLGIAGINLVDYHSYTDEAPVQRHTGSAFSAISSESTSIIELTCGGEALEAGVAKEFGFVVVANLDLETLTFKVYDTADNQLGSDITLDLHNVSSTTITDGKLASRMIYHKSATI